MTIVTANRVIRPVPEAPPPREVVPVDGLPPDVVLHALARMWANTLVADECYLWQGYTRNGYGSLSVCNRLTYMHRLSFLAHHGPLPDGTEVCHTCDIRRCWFPDHLYAGTRLQNVHDAWARGRASKPPRSAGEDHYRARLSDVEVEQVRSTTGSQREMAAAFGVSQSTIWRIKHGKVRA